MSKEVKRYSPDTNGRMREWPDGDYATWDDYDELAAENDRLRTKNDRMARERPARQALSIQLIDEARGLLAERDAEWISAETLPACPDAEITFEAKEYLVTNGYTVGICEFQRGHGCGRPWAAWGNYGSLKPSEITHWKPLPVPPALQGEQA